MDNSIKISKESTTHRNMISADGTVKFDFMTSLENIAIAKIVTLLWMHVETLKEITVTFPKLYSILGEKWKRIENNIVDKIRQLHLPNILLQKMRDVVKDVGESIFIWVFYHKECIFYHHDLKYSAFDLMNNIVWTTRGRIDYEQTAKSIFANQNILLDDKTKCILACNYCLEDEIPLLAPKLLEMFDDVDVDSDPMIYFWMKHIKGELNSSRNPRHNNMSDNEYIMQNLLRSDRSYNDIPIRFLWNRLSDEEVERNITSLVEVVDNQNYLFSLLSNLSYDQQQKVFKECPKHVLRCILNDWLWGEYILPTTCIVLKSLEFDKPLEYWRVLTKIFYRLCICSEDVERHIREEYKLIFKRLWRESSIECKDCIIQYKNCRSIQKFLASELSWERDMDIAEVILEYLTAVQKKNVAFGFYGVFCCRNFVLNDQWDMLECFLKHTLSTLEDINFLKKKLLEYGKKDFKYHFSEFESFDKVEHFLKWAFETEDEREKYKQTLRKKRKH